MGDCQVGECRQVGQVICNAEQPKSVCARVVALKLQRLQVGQQFEPLQEAQPIAFSHCSQSSTSAFWMRSARNSSIRALPEFATC